MVAPSVDTRATEDDLNSFTFVLMARFHPYTAVAETVGLTPKKVNEVVEVMMAVAASELKLVGTFKIAGALSMKLKKNPARPKKLVRLMKLRRLFVCRPKTAHNIVAMKVTKKFRKEMEKTCGDSSD